MLNNLAELKDYNYIYAGNKIQDLMPGIIVTINTIDLSEMKVNISYYGENGAKNTIFVPIKSLKREANDDRKTYYLNPGENFKGYTIEVKENYIQISDSLKEALDPNKTGYIRLGTNNSRIILSNALEGESAFPLSGNIISLKGMNLQRYVQKGTYELLSVNKVAENKATFIMDVRVSSTSSFKYKLIEAMQGTYDEIISSVPGNSTF